jgi:hypothetical protein
MKSNVEIVRELHEIMSAADYDLVRDTLPAAQAAELRAAGWSSSSRRCGRFVTAR